MYALLLDALGIDRAAVFGYSGGGPAAIQFALRHPGRTTTLILMASAPAVGSRMSPRGSASEASTPSTVALAMFAAVAFAVVSPDSTRDDDEAVPTLIINARDGGLSAFDNAARAAGRIRRSRLLAIDRGGHLLLGSEGRFKGEIAAFETSAT